jgi:hypothetical protein
VTGEKPVSGTVNSRSGIVAALEQVRLVAHDVGDPSAVPPFEGLLLCLLFWPHGGRFIGGAFEKRKPPGRRPIRAARAVSVRWDLMKQPVKDRRRKIGSARFEVNMDVQISGLNPQGIGFEGIGVVRNLSIRGAMIETHALVTTGDQLTLFVTLPHQDDLLEIPAVAVRWVRGPQLGVEFLKLDGETSRTLMTYLSGIHNAARGK